MCRAEFSLTKYFSFVAKQVELRRSRSMSFLLPRSQQRLASQLSLIVEEEGLVPEFQTRVGHSLITYHFHGSVDFIDNEAAEEENLEEDDIFIHDFDEMFQFVKKEEEQGDEMDDVVIVAHDFDTVFAGL